MPKRKQSRTQLNVTLPSDVTDNLREFSELSGIAMARIVEESLRASLMQANQFEESLRASMRQANEFEESLRESMRQVNEFDEHIKGLAQVTEKYQSTMKDLTRLADAHRRMFRDLAQPIEQMASIADSVRDVDSRMKALARVSDLGSLGGRDE